MANPQPVPTIVFRRLSEKDVPLMHRWLNRPAVKQWWDDSADTIEQVRAHYESAIRGDEPTQPFIIELDGRPVGYVQSYRPQNWPDYWGKLHLSDGAAGIDLFIGEDDVRHRGFGPLAIEAFIAMFFTPDPTVTEIIIDPDPTNFAAIRAYEKAAFVRLREVGPPEHGERALLMVRRIDRDH